jgi:broad specificity phosphatase PhoE
MLKEYQKQYKTIAVVTHYNIIRYTLAKEFNEHHEPFHCEIKNCALLPAVIAEL